MVTLINKVSKRGENPILIIIKLSPQLIAVRKASEWASLIRINKGLSLILIPKSVENLFDINTCHPFDVKWSICDKLCPSEIVCHNFWNPNGQGLIAIKNGHIS